VTYEEREVEGRGRPRHIENRHSMPGGDSGYRHTRRGAEVDPRHRQD